MTWRLILDTTAVAAFSTGSVHVGELLVEVDDEQGRVAVPALCLIEAGRGADDDRAALLQALIHHPAVDVVPLDGDRWGQHAIAADLYGDVEHGCVALLAADGGYVVTCDPGAYPGVDVIAV